MGSWQRPFDDLGVLLSSREELVVSRRFPHMLPRPNMVYGRDRGRGRGKCAAWLLEVRSLSAVYCMISCSSSSGRTSIGFESGRGIFFLPVQYSRPFGTHETCTTISVRNPPS